jgi:hypothetical protein
MMLGNRRLRLLYLALAGMDMAALLPWLTVLAILWARNGDARALMLQAMLTQNPLYLFVLFWATMQLYMLMADLLNRWEITGGLYAVAVLSLLTLTSLIGVRLLLYPTLAVADFRWLYETIWSLINIVTGVRGEILLILLNYFLWMRVARYIDRSFTFFSVGLSFRLGMLLTVIGSTLLSYWGNASGPAITYLVIFFAFGLCAVALARIDQKAVGAANSSGALLPWDRFAQLWVVIVLVLTAALSIARVYTPATLRIVLGWFAPVGQMFQWILTGFAWVLFWLLTPVLEWLAARMQEMMPLAEPLQMGENAPELQPLTLMEAVQEIALLRYCIAAAIIFAALIMVIIFFTRMQRRERTAEAEDTATEGMLQPGAINLGLNRLKDWLAMLGRYGVGSQLLAAISVENIYANLTRVARQRGFPRHPSQGPDHYLPRLMLAFPDHDAELMQVTAAYMRVRYAERPISPAELDDLRAAYAAITAPPDAKRGEQTAK